MMTYTLSYENANGDRIDFGLREGIVIGELSGTSGISVSTTLSQGFSQVGASIQGRSVNPGVLIMRGTILGESAQMAEKLRNTILPLVDGVIIFNRQYELRVVTSKTPEVNRTLFNTPFDCAFDVPNPYWRDRVETRTLMAGLVPAWHFPWNISKPYRFSKREEGLFRDIYNHGNVPIPITIIFVATVNGVSIPSLTKVSTGEYIRINKTMTAMERIIVDMTDIQNGLTITSEIGGTVSNAFGYLDIDSTLFTLDKGTNLIRYYAEANIDGLDCFVMTRNMYTGVYAELGAI